MSFNRIKDYIMKKMLIAALVAATCSGSVFAQDEVGNNAKANLEAKVERLGWGGLVDISVDKMNNALKEKYPNTGLTLMSLENARGKNIFFVDETATYMLKVQDGQVFTENGLVSLQSILVDMALKSSETEWPSHTLPDGVNKSGDMYVFTDPTCGYCAKLERELDSYLESGVKVHYIPFPRAGVSDIENPAFKTWAVAMCDEAPAVAYRSYTTRQKDMPVDASYTEDCADKIKEGYGMAKTLGLSGTPFIYYQGVGGNTVTKGGYLPVDIMLQELGVESVKKSPAAPSAE